MVDSLLLRGGRDKGDNPLETTEVLNSFLAGVERRAFLMARLATGNDDDALDLVQEGMFELVRRYGRRPESEWKTLFYRIMQSRITDWHRRTLVRNRFRVWFDRQEEGADEPDPIEQLADRSTPDAATRLLLRETGASIDRALRELPLRQRQAFLLRAWEELDVAETAFVMGCSQGSVKTHYFRAIQALRRKLKDYEP
jgi:RNA polymerase sigma-70 factor (ECF subfamily)